MMNVSRFVSISKYKIGSIIPRLHFVCRSDHINRYSREGFISSYNVFIIVAFCRVCQFGYRCGYEAQTDFDEAAVAFYLNIESESTMKQ